MKLDLKVDYMEDRTFKIMFLHQDILDYLSEYHIEIEHVNAQMLIPADSKYLKDYFGDIIAYAKKAYVSLEAFSKEKNYNAEKSLLYATRLYGNQLEYGEDTKNIKKVYSRYSRLWDC